MMFFLSIEDSMVYGDFRLLSERFACFSLFSCTMFLPCDADDEGGPTMGLGSDCDDQCSESGICLSNVTSRCSLHSSGAIALLALVFVIVEGS